MDSITSPQDNLFTHSVTEEERHSDQDDHASLQSQLEILRNEKASLESQYGALLSKLTTMRNTLGDKLRQDADELDRREQSICQLQNQNEELVHTTETLRSELILAHEETEQLHQELAQTRTRLLDQQRSIDSENSEREESFRETQEEIERLRNQLDYHKRELMNETVRREHADLALREKDNIIASLKREIDSIREDRDLQANSASNLQSVLEEFQSAKEDEIQSVVSDTQSRLIDAEKKLSILEKKAMETGAKLSASESAAAECESLKKELKEKNLLAGKLRHEAVILNEHLTEALRRLRKDNTEFSVDRRLVTNVLLSFILTPREDTKRFEMLSLLASILSWNEDQREQVGLKRSSGNNSMQKQTRNKINGEDQVGDNDTITDQWVSFLLREANSATPPNINTSLSNLSINSPSTSTRSPPPLSGKRKSPDPFTLPSSPRSTLTTLSTLTRPTSDFLS